MRTPSYEEYRAAGHDHATAEALVGVDGICAMHHQVNVMRHALKHGNARPRGAGRPKARTSSARRSSERSGDSGDPDEEPVRLCANARCRADISHLHVLAEYCDNGGACKQAAYRDRQVLDYLDAVAGTTTTAISCRCEPRGQLVVDGVCFPCGRPRGAVTREWGPLTRPRPMTGR